MYILRHKTHSLRYAQYKVFLLIYMYNIIYYALLYDEFHWSRPQIPSHVDTNIPCWQIQQFLRRRSTYKRKSRPMQLCRKCIQNCVTWHLWFRPRWLHTNNSACLIDKEANRHCMWFVVIGAIGDVCDWLEWSDVNVEWCVSNMDA